MWKEFICSDIIQYRKIVSQKEKTPKSTLKGKKNQNKIIK